MYNTDLNPQSDIFYTEDRDTNVLIENILMEKLRRAVVNSDKEEEESGECEKLEMKVMSKRSSRQIIKSPKLKRSSTRIIPKHKSRIMLNEVTGKMQLIPDKLLPEDKSPEKLSVLSDKAPNKLTVISDKAPEKLIVISDKAPEKLIVISDKAPEKLIVISDKVPQKFSVLNDKAPEKLTVISDNAYRKRETYRSFRRSFSKYEKYSSSEVVQHSCTDIPVDNANTVAMDTTGLTRLGPYDSCADTRNNNRNHVISSPVAFIVACDQTSDTPLRHPAREDITPCPVVKHCYWLPVDDVRLANVRRGPANRNRRDKLNSSSM